MTEEDKKTEADNNEKKKRRKELLDTGKYAPIIIEKIMSVADFVRERGLEDFTHLFSVLVNGKKVDLDYIISKSDQVIIIPNITGGLIVCVK